MMEERRDGEQKEMKGDDGDVYFSEYDSTKKAP